MRVTPTPRLRARLSQFIQQIREGTTAQQTPAFIDEDVHWLFADRDCVIQKPGQHRMHDGAVLFTQGREIEVPPLTGREVRR